MALTNQQKLFCEEYIIDLNGTQAAIRAKYSAKTAEQQASRLLSNVKVQQHIAELQKGREIRTQVTQDRVLLEIARLAFNDPRKAFDTDGNLKQVQDWPDEVAAAISSIKVVETKSDDDTTSQVKEVKFWDKGKQIELAGKHLGMFTDKFSIGGDKDNPLTVIKRLIIDSSDD